MRIKSHPRLISSRVSIVAQGFMEVISNQPLKVMLSNLSKKSINLPKRMYLTLGVDVPHRIVKFPTDEEIYSVNKIPHHKEKEDKQTKMGGHRKLADADDTRLKED